ncbi:MAG: hypothetical protein AB1483_05955 [Candidatus Zixiibacteriota bacterium]
MKKIMAIVSIAVFAMSANGTVFATRPFVADYDSPLSFHSLLMGGSAKPPDDAGHFSYAISGLFTTKSDGIGNGFGIGFTGFFDNLRPLVARAGIDIVISSLDIENLPEADFVVLSPTLDLTLRRPAGRLRPYAGVGISLYFNHLYLDEPADISISGYDSTTQAQQIDMGWGITPHLRLGLVIPVGKKQHLVVDFRLMSASHDADISYRDRYTGDEWEGTVNYRVPSVWISVGIISSR